MAVQGAAAVCLPPAKPQCGQGRTSAAPALPVQPQQWGAGAGLWGEQGEGRQQPCGCLAQHPSGTITALSPIGQRGQHQVAAARSWGLWGACAPMPPALGWEATPCIKPSLPPHRDTQLLRKPLSPWAALPMTCPLPGPHNHQNHVQICVIYDWILQCHLQASVTVLGDCVPCGSFKQCICASSLSTCLRVGGFQK